MFILKVIYIIYIEREIDNMILTELNKYIIKHYLIGESFDTSSFQGTKKLKIILSLKLKRINTTRID